MPESNEIIVDSIIVDESGSSLAQDSGSELVLFSSLKADAKPIVKYNINVGGIEYPIFYSAKCAICNSPHRTLLEHVYIDSGKKVNQVLKFFEKHFNAKLNWPQVKQHMKFHVDMNKIETPGLKDYENQEEEVARWKYREHELALTAMLVELNDVRGVSARTPDEIFKRASMIERLTKVILIIKQQRDDNVIGLPNVFEVLYELHGLMVSEEDQRIIREKVTELKSTLK